ERMRRVGVLMNLTADDDDASPRVTALAQGLQQLGWTAGRNVRIDYRWGAVDADRSRRYATELLALAPDVILASSSPAVPALQQATPAVRVVFANVVDPVGAGLVDSLAQPGGNATGFILYEYGLSAKWLDLLKEIAPRLGGASTSPDRRSQLVAAASGYEPLTICLTVRGCFRRDHAATDRGNMTRSCARRP